MAKKPVKTPIAAAIPAPPPMAQLRAAEARPLEFLQKVCIDWIKSLPEPAREGASTDCDLALNRINGELKRLMAAIEPAK